MILINKAHNTQTLFLTAIGGPAMILPLELLVPDASIDITDVYVNQTEPPFVRRIHADTVTDLALDDASFTYKLKISNRETGEVMVDGDMAFTLDTDGSALVSYDWDPNAPELDEPGVFRAQVRVITNADPTRVLMFEMELLTVRVR